MRRTGWTLFLPALSLVCAALAASCGDSPGGDGSAWPGGATGPGTSGGATAGNGGPGGVDDAGADGGVPSALPDAATPPQTDDSGSPPPGVSGEAGTTGDAAACSIGPAGPLGLIPGGTMSPGLACVSCHVTTGAKKLNAGGTVYPTLHEADLCLGTPSGVQVVITDAQGTDHTLSVDTSGNFYDTGLLGFSTPYKAKVVGAAGSAPMLTPQTNFDCNACHTAQGAQGAAGRIIGP